MSHHVADTLRESRRGGERSGIARGSIRARRFTPTIDSIKAGKSLEEIKSAWVGEFAEFRRRRKWFLLYA